MMTTSNPSPNEIKTTPIAAGLTQKAAGERFGYALITWQQKEAAGKTNRKLSPGEFEFLQLLPGTHSRYTLVEKKGVQNDYRNKLHFTF
ncbi:hypothetical protein [Gibbsiella quercinecans]|uniref:hypothetical protein n=1 Tax=Gibbsiella quercinecans TaxID=929813 RepID=UPI002432E364|nr:hypothetical protein [Gibbsiella quercinecans]